jgi:thioredoxin-related protein
VERIIMAKRRYLPWFAAYVCVMLMACQGPAGAQDEGIPWRSSEEALQEAKDVGRPIYLYFVMDNCIYCRKMDRETLSDREVEQYLREHFISARINAKDDAQLLRKYVIRGFPTSCFLTAEGENISCLPGYVGPEYFIRMLKYIGEGHFKSESLSLLLMEDWQG